MAWSKFEADPFSSKKVGAGGTSQGIRKARLFLNQLASEYRTAIIVVTHDEKIMPAFRRIYGIRDGRTVGEAGVGRAIGSSNWA